MAKGRFDRLVACSSAEPSSGTAHEMIGTRPGLRTQGRALGSVSVTPSVAAVLVLVDMAAGPPASVLVAAIDAAEDGRTRAVGWPSGVEPPSPGPQPGALAVELRPPPWENEDRPLG